MPQQRGYLLLFAPRGSQAVTATRAFPNVRMHVFDLGPRELAVQKALEVLESLGRYEAAERWYEVAAQDYGAELYQAVFAKARVRLSAARR